MKTNPWLVLAIVSSALMLIGIDMTVLNAALPRLTQDLGATNSDKLWMVNAYSLVMAGLLPGFGTLSDKVGHRRMLVWGLLIFGAASTIAAFSPTAVTLIASRGLLAIGAAMMMPATISFVRVAFTEDRPRAVAIGIWGSVASGAAAVGPIIGGFLLEYFWWGSVFLINVPVVLVTLILTIRFIPNLPGNPKRTWDLLTSALIMVGLVGLVYTLKGVLKPEVHWNEVAIAATIGIAFTSLFVWRQSSLSSPLLDFGLFRNARFTLGTVSVFVASFALIGTHFVFSQELQLVRGMSPLHAGFLMLPMAAASFAAGPILGAYLHKFGIERTLALILGVAVIGIVLFTFTGDTGSLVWEVATLALVGFGLGGAMSVASTSIMISAPESHAGMAGSVESISYELGATFGVAVMGSVLASIYGQSIQSPAGVNLPTGARDSIDQAMLGVQSLPAGLAQQILDAARSAFMTGVINSLTLATALVFILTVGVAVYARDKRPGKVVMHH